MNWKKGGLSLPGFSHIDNEVPCQDYHIVSLTKNNNIIGIVADGAGSAKHSHIGSKLFSEVIFDALNKIDNLMLVNEELIREKVIKYVNKAKKSLFLDPPENLKIDEITIKDFSTTMLAVIANNEVGYFIHIGDGVGVSFLNEDFANCCVSKPHNGEYSNETYFLTMDGWEKHLRITKIKNNFDSILLMSDGVSPMAMSKGFKQPFRGFVKPIIDYIKKEELEKSLIAIKNTLISEKVKKITDDDKTLVWALKL